MAERISTTIFWRLRYILRLFVMIFKSYILMYCLVIWVLKKVQVKYWSRKRKILITSRLHTKIAETNGSVIFKTEDFHSVQRNLNYLAILCRKIIIHVLFQSNLIKLSFEIFLNSNWRIVIWFIVFSLSFDKGVFYCFLIIRNIKSLIKPNLLKPSMYHLQVQLSNESLNLGRRLACLMNVWN